jgi:hypothetical protein
MSIPNPNTKKKMNNGINKKNNEQIGLQEAMHLQDSKPNHSKTLKKMKFENSRNSLER